MIEKTILDYLKTALTPTAVYMEVPPNPPTKYVVLEKTGSSRKDYINSATFAVQSIDESLFKAATLNESVKTAMDSLPTIASIGSSKLNSDYNFTDTATKKYRYQAVYDIVYK